MTSNGKPDDPFARIAGAAQAAPGGAAAGKADAKDGVHVSPVPADAPPVPTFNKVPGRLSAKWAYRDASGAVLRWTLRFQKDDGEKDIRPATLWRDPTTGVLKWRLAAGDEPRPLYGLDALAARPDAVVLLVEGEKTADAAAERFPSYVAMTWPGGGNAVSKADFSPLAGRAVVIWPDADEPGSRAAQSAVKACMAAGAVGASVVDLPADLPKGWDLADPWTTVLDAKVASDLIDRAIQSGRTEVIIPRGYRSDAAGWWWAPDSDSKGDAPPPPVWLCGPFQVAALARDEEGLTWSLVLDFKDMDGRKKREIIGKAELAGDGVEVRRRMMGAGLQISTGRAGRDRLQSLLAGLATVQRARLVSSTGWKHGLYVLPHRTVGAAVAEPVIFQGRTGGTYHGEAGSYASWRSDVAAPMQGNALGVFAMSAAFAGPLLRPLNGEGGGFHFRGGSSTGKTTLLAVAGSICGGGGPMGFSQSWRNTDNALEAVALAHNDGMLALDELRALSADAAGAAAYALATGATKGRLRPDAELRARPTWRVMILSTGELSLADLIRLARGKDKAYAGQELRLIDVAVDMGLGLGAWETIGDAESPAAFSEAVKKAGETHYGHALPMFVERYLAKRVEMDEAAAVVQAEFLDTVLQDDDHGQARRGAQRFAVVAAAGELAALLDVVPWSPGEASAAAAKLFRRWAGAFGRTTQREDREAVLRVKGFLERYEGSRFRALKEDESEEDRLYDEGKGRGREGEARSLDAAGWKGVHEGHGTVFHFNPEFARTDLFSGMDANAALKALKKSGFLVSNGGEGRLTNKVALPGGEKRNFYSIKATILEAELYDEGA